MSLCHCDGPPHPYDPAWCRGGRSDNGRPIDPALAEQERRRIWDAQHAPWDGTC